MAEKDISQELERKKKIDETRNYLIEEINRNELMSKKHRDLFNSKLYWKLSCFSFYNHWMYFNFCFYFFDSHS